MSTALLSLGRYSELLRLQFTEKVWKDYEPILDFLRNVKLTTKKYFEHLEKEIYGYTTFQYS